MITAGCPTCVVESHGLRIGFHANDARLLASAGCLLPPGSRDATGEAADIDYSIERDEDGRLYRAYYGGNRDVLLSSPHLECVLEFLQRHVHFAVAENAVEHLFVHAGAVAWRGKAILLPGPSCSGKSELVRELIRAGAAYCSDEFAALDAAGCVHSFARPLSLRLPNGRRFCEAGEFGAETATGPIPAGLVVVTRYEAGESFDASPISPGEALLELLANTVSARANPLRAVQILKAAVSRAPAIRSRRGEAAAAAPAILSLAEHPTFLSLLKRNT